MKSIKLLTVCALAALLLSACGTPNTTNTANTSNSASTTTTDATKESVETAIETPAAKADTTEDNQAPDDFWTYYNDAKWEDDFKGLESKILKVVVSDKAPRLDDQSKMDASVVGVKFELNNTTTGKFTSYPDQAVLVTSTGEQIDMPNSLVSDHIGGEIDEGVKKEGKIIWYLKRGNAKDIKWIKMKWNTHAGGESDIMNKSRKEYEVKIQLK